MWYENVGTSFFRFATIQAFDRRADGGADRLFARAKTALHRCIAVNMKFSWKSGPTSLGLVTLAIREKERQINLAFFKLITDSEL